MEQLSASENTTEEIEASKAFESNDNRFILNL
jgi:hypothetical protein